MDGRARTNTFHNRIVLAFALLFTFWAMWRWVEVFSAAPPPGAHSERRARVLELVCSTVAALVATGFCSSRVLRGAVAEFTGLDNRNNWNSEGPIVDLGPNDVVEVAESGLEPSAANGPAADAWAAGISERAEWVRRAMECLANDLTLINGYTDMLLTDGPGKIGEELKQIRHAGERSTLLVQQFRLVADPRGVATQSLDLSALVDLIRPRLNALVSPDVELSLSLHQDGVPVQGDPGSLAIAIGSLVAEADRINSGPRICMAAGNHTLTIEATAASATAAQLAASPGFQAANSIVRLSGGTLAVGENQGQILFRVTLLPF